ncbi:MAG: response regulator [Candidatus Parcubacteria bacterium]|nr:response regulator [Candidatus Parcubacteria bacterium]
MSFKILLVDDENNVRIALKRVLRNKDYEIVEAGDGFEALQKLEQDFFDLLITDNDMPIKTGIELISEITSGQKTIKNPEMRIILLSGKGKPANLPAGVEFMLKPWDSEKLITTVRQFQTKAVP